MASALKILIRTSAFSKIVALIFNGIIFNSKSCCPFCKIKRFIGY
jgi:hypothetical protein